MKKVQQMAQRRTFWNVARFDCIAIPLQRYDISAAKWWALCRGRREKPQILTFIFLFLFIRWNHKIYPIPLYGPPIEDHCYLDGPGIIPLKGTGEPQNGPV